MLGVKKNLTVAVEGGEFRGCPQRSHIETAGRNPFENNAPKGPLVADRVNRNILPCHLRCLVEGDINRLVGGCRPTGAQVFEGNGVRARRDIVHRLIALVVESVVQCPYCAVCHRVRRQNRHMQAAARLAFALAFTAGRDAYAIWLALRVASGRGGHGE